MSLLTKEERISIKPFARVPAIPLLGLSSIERSAASVSNVSSTQGTGDEVDLSEGCLVTKSVRYTHQLAHWVNPGKNDDREAIEYLISRKMRIVASQAFSLDDPCNLVYLEPSVYSSLNLYAFIAITASSSTIDELLKIVRSDNERRQQSIDEEGLKVRRSLDFSLPSIADPSYELIALHPEHFLPGNAVLTVYGPTPEDRKEYVVAEDRCLRETRSPLSPRLPPFHHASDRPLLTRLNVFLVILNAEIKFRRYFEMIQHHAPLRALPNDVLDVMRKTMKLVDLLYWEPAPTKGSKGELILAQLSQGRAYLAKRPLPLVDCHSSDEMETDEDLQTPSIWELARHHRKLDWLANADLETRKAYGTALMSGHYDYDPALFEDAFPLGNNEQLYSEPTAAEVWRHGVTIGELSHPSFVTETY